MEGLYSLKLRKNSPVLYAYMNGIFIYMNTYGMQSLKWKQNNEWRMDMVSYKWCVCVNTFYCVNLLDRSRSSSQCLIHVVGSVKKKVVILFECHVTIFWYPHWPQNKIVNTLKALYM